MIENRGRKETVNRQRTQTKSPQRAADKSISRYICSRDAPSGAHRSASAPRCNSASAVSVCPSTTACTSSRLAGARGTVRTRERERKREKESGREREREGETETDRMKRRKYYEGSSKSDRE